MLIRKDNTFIKVENLDKFSVTMSIHTDDTFIGKIYPTDIDTTFYNLNTEVFEEFIETTIGSNNIQYFFANYQALADKIEKYGPMGLYPFKSFSEDLLALIKPHITTMMYVSKFVGFSKIVNLLVPIIGLYRTSAKQPGTHKLKDQLKLSISGYHNDYGFVGSCLKSTIDYIDDKYPDLVVESMLIDHYGHDAPLKDIFGVLHKYHLEIEGCNEDE